MRCSATLLFPAMALSGAARAQSTPLAASVPKFVAIGNNVIPESRYEGKRKR